MLRRRSCIDATKGCTVVVGACPIQLEGAGDFVFEGESTYLADDNFDVAGACPICVGKASERVGLARKALESATERVGLTGKASESATKRVGLAGRGN